MLWNWIAWRIARTSILVSLILSSALIVFQFTSFDKILFSIPAGKSLLFILIWLLYATFYFFPTSSFIGSSLVFFEIKEEKKLHILQSFGVSSFALYSKTLVRLIPILFLLIVVSFLLHEEDISFMRRYLTYKYYTSLIYSFPEKNFSTFGDVTLYVERKSGNNFYNVFFKKGDDIILARRALLEGDNIIFREGVSLIKEEKKSYLTGFSKYTLNLEKLVNVERRKDILKRDEELNLINSFSLPILVTLGYILANTKLQSITRLYYLVGVISILYQIFLLLLKSLL
ncbi:MAG: LptF/LptG family permease [Aquificaceae bacterium]